MSCSIEGASTMISALDKPRYTVRRLKTTKNVRHVIELIWLDYDRQRSATVRWPILRAKLAL